MLPMGWKYKGEGKISRWLSHNTEERLIERIGGVTRFHERDFSEVQNVVVVVCISFHPSF
jgi:hypothetical protein